MKAINKIIGVMVIALLCSCKNNKDGLMQTKTVNNICYNLQYCPKNDMKNDAGSIEPADLFYYKLTISEEKKPGVRIANLYMQSNYNKLLYYINQNIQNDFKTVVDFKDIVPVQVYFESNNRMAQRLIFMLAFEKPLDKEGDLTVEFNDNIFNNGKIKFKYDIKELI